MLVTLRPFIKHKKKEWCPESSTRHFQLQLCCVHASIQIKAMRSVFAMGTIHAVAGRAYCVVFFQANHKLTETDRQESKSHALQ